MIQHVLLDADGVLQDVPGGWVAAAYMRGLYDGLFDTACYSCELGLVKTQPESHGMPALRTRLSRHGLLAG
ncbi:MAG TPA: hypothetical protein VFG98_02745 [Intrasporangium sp.]|nr:hypothetical protein [Intrasporangium sp.]